MTWGKRRKAAYIVGGHFCSLEVLSLNARGRTNYRQTQLLARCNRKAHFRLRATHSLHRSFNSCSVLALPRCARYSLLESPRQEIWCGQCLLTTSLCHDMGKAPQGCLQCLCTRIYLELNEETICTTHISSPTR